MTGLTTHFTAKARKNLDMLKDSLTVMFADTRHGFLDKKTEAAFDRMKERADGDARMAKYVAKMELSIGDHVPHVLTHALHRNKM